MTAFAAGGGGDPSTVNAWPSSSSAGSTRRSTADSMPIGMDDVDLTLEHDGVASFHDSFRHVLGVLDAKASRLTADPAQNLNRVALSFR